MIDSTACPLHRPSTMSRSFYSPKHHAYVYKYEVAVHPDPPHHIVWVLGPVRGHIHDITIARAAFIKRLVPEERALGDLGYLGEPHAIVTPIRSPVTQEEKHENKELHAVRSCVEREFAALKTFAVLRTSWRGELQNHGPAFLACCVLRELAKVVKYR